ncbi:MAG: sulfatase-like hydrolase/transferase, partial [Deltaproteobacteria bacterium]|nr:sulfatase-like hydrolase/transferase [Deltaproteobacteria bacterium]
MYSKFMKLFLFPFCIITTLSFFLGSSALSIDNSQDVPKNDFNIVLITIDALRADHLSCYGYERETSPNIDRIAEKGIIFKNTIASSSWTAPSMASLFTSLYPINHGVIHGMRYANNKTIYNQEVFSSELATLAEILQAYGYTTFGVASNLHLSEKFGFAKGFNYFKCLPWDPAQSVNKIVYSWEKYIKKSDKFFLWIHYFDPHHAYHARSPWIEQYTPKALTRKLNLTSKSSSELIKLIPTFKKDPQALSNLVALYDSEINYVDSYLGKLIQKFGLNKNTLLIITADHGEGFLDHSQLGHGNNLYYETTNIPLIIKLPYNSKKRIVNKYVNLVDIMPTILHILDINSPEQTLGKSVLKKKGPLLWFKKMLIRREKPEYSFAELDKGSILKTLITPEWKYIYDYKKKNEQLYNIKSDLLELNNLVDKETEQCNQLKEQLFNWASSAKKYLPKRRSIQLSPEERKKLEAMGYLQVTDDIDKDGIPDNDDNCPYVFNPNQKDTYPPGGNGIGDACDCEGDFNCDGNV